ENFTIIARDGAQFVGLTQLQALKDSGTAYNYFTGVTRSYRGHNVALALKLLAIRNARQANIPSMSTYNDSENAPMLAINQKLGYERTPGHYLAKKTL
ncbi:MAG: GNAT family N-acetyltransferase, partial [Tumebacillaceae bacterium]